MQSITYDNTKTVRQLLDKAVHECKNEVYIRYEKDDVVHDITYEQFGELSRKISAFVNDRKQKLKRQVRIAILSGSNANYIALLIGVMGSGNVVVPMDNQLDIEHVADILNRADIDILFYDWEYEQLVNDVKPECPNVSEYYLIKKIENHPCIDDIYNNPRYTGKEWVASDVEDTEAAPDDVALIIYTSGTTGRSKGVMLTHANLVGNVLSVFIRCIQKPVNLMILPLHHIFCINTDVLVVMYRGGTVCINGHISKLGKNLQLFQPVELHVVPMIAKVLYNKIKAVVAAHPGLTESAALRLVYGKNLQQIVCGGGGLSKELAKKYYDMGVRIGQGYGMSECAAVVSEPELDTFDKLESSGKVIERCNVRISDVGEIQLKSPFVMKGYYKDPELTKEAFTEDGWFRTGDVGYVDKDGFLYLTGRIKNLIILSNGENVSPEEIEQTFNTENLVSDIIVFQEDDVIKCEIFPDLNYAKAAGIQNVEEVLKKIVNDHNCKLPSYKRITSTSFRYKPFKKTSSNKIIRQAFLDERNHESIIILNARHPETDEQKKVYNVCVECLGHKKFGIDTNLYSMGLDSYGSVLLLSTLYKKHKLSLTLSELMENPTVESIVNLWEQKKKQNNVDYTPREKYLLPDKSLHFMNTWRNNSSATLSYLFKLSNKIDMKHLEDSIIQYFNLNPILFSKIEPDKDGKMYIHRKSEGTVKIEKMKLTSSEWEEKQKQLVVTWEYKEVPGDDLYRAGLYETTDDGGKYFYIELSHLIGDGTSMRKLVGDISRIYIGEKLEKPDYTFFEYILDELNRKEIGTCEKDAAVYKEYLKGFNLTRNALSRKDCYELHRSVNACHYGYLTKLEKKKVEDFCSVNDITENSFFLTAFSYTLSIFSNLDDVLITSINNGRTDGRYDRVIGQLFEWYPFRFKKVKHESVLHLLKKNSDQILNHMKVETSIRPDEYVIQYQGDLLNYDKFCGEDCEFIELDLDSTPFHVMIFSTDKGYPFRLWYGSNRFDDELVKVFFDVLNDICYAMLIEKSVRKLQNYISSNFIPKHLSVPIKVINSLTGNKIIDTDNEDAMVKPYVLDNTRLKKPYGAWGKLYVLNQPVIGSLYYTGIIARIMPNGSIETLNQAGRLVCYETIYDRYYVDLYKLEQTLKEYQGVDNAQCSLVYSEKNIFVIKAHINSKQKPNEEELKKYVENKLGKGMVPEIIMFN